jgi:hypothetical protein
MIGMLLIGKKNGTAVDDNLEKKLDLAALASMANFVERHEYLKGPCGNCQNEH